MKSLFGHIALKFAAFPENFATEALHYTLTESAEARVSFARLLCMFGNPISDQLHYSTQVHSTQVSDESRSIPDMSGSDENGKRYAIIEVKFGANLTNQQPVGYLELPLESSGILLFIVPERRIVTFPSGSPSRRDWSGIPILRIANSKGIFAFRHPILVGENIRF